MGKVLRMGIINLTPDSFWEGSRYNYSVLDSGFDIVDVGAVSTRPGAESVPEDEEWERMKPFLERIKDTGHPRISIDTTRSGIIKRALDYVPDIIVNDISAGLDDPEMLPLAGRNSLTFIAMHKRGTPGTMDSMCDYPDGVIQELKRYFTDFAARAGKAGVKDWILDPGLGFAKTPEQCWEILEHLEELSEFGRPILVGAADKRFTGGDNMRAEELAIRHGASILRVHR